MKRPQSGTALHRQRGFLLLVVIGTLAVLLTVCVGFLSYTRGEMQAVANQRDESDTVDLVNSATDWTIASICKDVMTSSGAFDPSKIVAQSKAGGNWWYRPYEQNTGKALNDLYVKNGWNWSEWNYIPDYSDPNSTEAPWVYLPQDFYPGGGVRARFMVQVLDPNSCMNINDWNEDCNPTQCQMAHMMMDAYGDQNLEGCRAFRDANQGNGAATDAPKFYLCPIRYHEAWRPVTRTERYTDWMYWYRWDTVDNCAAYNWTTANSTWYGLFGPDMGSLRSIIQSDGIGVQAHWQSSPREYSYKGSPNFYPVDPPDGARIQHGGSTPFMSFDRNSDWNQDVAGQGYYLSGFTCQSYVDPDTGRSPINVNTCYNSGEYLPMHMHRTNPTFTMEGVFNIESLRRIIKVGNFGPNPQKNAQTSWATLTPAEKMKVEQLKTKLAYQYQETLCRYFTGSYAHATLQRDGAGKVSRSLGRITSPVQTPVYKMLDDYRKNPDFGGINHDLGTYSAVYTGVAALNHACATTDYSQPRFNTDLATFRQWVRDDLVIMTQSNTTFVTPLPPGIFGPDVTDGTVSFDPTDKPQIAQGKLDMRTAAAVFDNIVPGKPASDLATYFKCQAFTTPTNGTYPNGDPLFELYTMQLARQEDMDDPCSIGTASDNIYGSWTDNAALKAIGGFKMGTSFPGGIETDLKDSLGNNMSLFPKGRDICLKGYATAQWPQGPWQDNPVTPPSGVPSRQLAFGPDSFSTELTTTTTNFMLVINAQLVDSASVAANPANPALHRVMYWNQWGSEIEVAPDVMADSDTDARNPDRQYYQRELPKYRKTNQPDLAGKPWMDNACPSLVSRNWAGNGNRVTNNPTGILDWQADIRSVPPAGTAGVRGADVIYTPSNQTQKRVILRSIWCLNEGIQQ